MISATDSFIKYLSTELAGDPLVNWVHVTTSDNNSSDLKMEALNVTTLGIEQDGPIEEILVSLDILGSDERTVMNWALLVRDKLLERQYTAELTYTPDPATPTAMGRMVEWRNDSVGFSIVGAGQSYFHMNATLPLRHSRW